MIDKMENKKTKTKEPMPSPLYKSPGITTAFYISEDNINLLKEEARKQNRSLSWLVNKAIEMYYGGVE